MIAPSGVQSPEALSKTARTITAGWALPDRPNGIITSYQLQLNSVTVYTGTARNYTLSGLSVFNPYRLVLIGNAHHILFYIFFFLLDSVSFNIVLLSEKRCSL